MPGFNHFSILNSVYTYSFVINFLHSLVSVAEVAFGVNVPFQIGTHKVWIIFGDELSILQRHN